MIWPAPEAATVTIFGGTLDLPVRPPQAATIALPPLPGPETATPERPTAGPSGRRAHRSPRPRGGHRGQVRIRHQGRRSAERLGRDAAHRDDPARRLAGADRDLDAACPARATPSCCRRRSAPGRAPTKSVIANGTALSRAISCDVARLDRRRGHPAAVDLFQQRLGFLEIERVEAFGEPAEERRQKLVRLAHLALSQP